MFIVMDTTNITVLLRGPEGSEEITITVITIIAIIIVVITIPVLLRGWKGREEVTSGIFRHICSPSFSLSPFLSPPSASGALTIIVFSILS